MNTFNSTIKNLYSLKGIKLGLDRVKTILKKLNHPQKKFQSIHIAGTNGKGSTAFLLFNVLKEANFKVGLYTSPHLLKFNERIRVDTKNISDKEIVNHYAKIVEVAGPKHDLTFFEATTIIAFLEFEKRKVDIAIIETGLGGRLDATNVVTPLITIITNIDVEHKEYLGNSIESITKEKAGIIKNRTPILSCVKQRKAINLLKEIAYKKKSPLYLVKRDRDYFKYQMFYNKKEVKKRLEEFNNITIGLEGDWQKENVALALLTTKLLIKKYGYNIDASSYIKGIKKSKVKARFQTIQKRPLIIIDAAHNLFAIKRVFSFIDKKYEKKKVLIIGLAKDKQYRPILKLAAKNFDYVIATEGKNKRLFKSEILYEELLKHTKKCYSIPSMKKAREKALSLTNREDLVFVTGSFFILEEFIMLC